MCGLAVVRHLLQIGFKVFMDSKHPVYKVIIIGSGPAGLSAAARAARLKVPHILLESAPQLANTLFDYPLGKHVMAEPGYLPLRSDIEFAAGKREYILESWQQLARQYRVNTAFNSKVLGVVKDRAGIFTVSTQNGAKYRGEKIILAIGMQGNPNLLPCTGADIPQVQYKLKDPAKFKGEQVIVVGAGDSAIEAALALAQHGKVVLINRGDGFARAKAASRKRVLDAIAAEQITCLYGATIDKVAKSDGTRPVVASIKTGKGMVSVKCNRIIAQLGAKSPRGFLESIGIRFSGDSADALPQLTSRYESNVAGIFILGALSGQPLIKQALNQGHDCVEYIRGNPQVPLEQALIEKKIKQLKIKTSYKGLIAFIKRIELFAGMSELRIRDILLESTLCRYKKSQTVYTEDQFSKSIYVVLNGSIALTQHKPEHSSWQIGAGQFFGEQGLLFGRVQHGRATARQPCVIMEMPRFLVVKLMQSEAHFRQCTNKYFICRTVASYIAPEISDKVLHKVLRHTEYTTFKTGDVLFQPGQKSERLYIVRQGSISISGNDSKGTEDYLPAGSILGAQEAWFNTAHGKYARAVVDTEIVGLDKSTLQTLIKYSPKVMQRVQRRTNSTFASNLPLKINSQTAHTFDSLLEDGLGEATDVLIIDKSLCVGCDNCERACAGTHQGVSRLRRKAGTVHGNLHIPVACRHCEQPKCMSDCPANAIHRGDGGEITIQDSCIGCGACAENCPYGVIQIAEVAANKPSIFFPGLGALIEQAKGYAGGGASTEATPKAVKCDLCATLRTGPACVNSCPTGAAKRLKSDKLIPLLSTA